jgi:hypothetical protein
LKVVEYQSTVGVSYDAGVVECQSIVGVSYDAGVVECQSTVGVSYDAGVDPAKGGMRPVLHIIMLDVVGIFFDF